MKVLKKIAFVLKIIILIDIIFILGVFVYNRIMLIKEKSITTAPLGQMVEIDGNNMCVYTEGEGEHTLVFMSGWDVASPILDFRSL